MGYMFYFVIRNITLTYARGVIVLYSNWLCNMVSLPPVTMTIAAVVAIVHCIHSRTMYSLCAIMAATLQI